MTSFCYSFGMKQYKAILFDFDDTLVNYLGTREAACRFFWRKELFLQDFLGENAFFELVGRINDQRWREFVGGKRWPNRNVLEVSLDDVFTELGVHPDRREALRQDFLDALCRNPVLEAGAMELLDYLYGNFSLGMITNGLSRTQALRIEGAGMSAYFDSVAISGELGVAKPDPAIFHHCLAEMGIGAGQALYVGDSIWHGAAGVAAAGLDFCWYRPPNRDPEGYTGLEITRLAELADLLEGNPSDMA